MKERTKETMKNQKEKTKIQMKNQKVQRRDKKQKE